MKSIFAFFLKYIHIIIIANTGFNFYQNFNEHTEIIQNKQDQLPILDRKIVKAQRSADLVRSFQEDLENSKIKVEAVAQQIEKIQKQLPNSISDTEILDTFSKEAGLINIKNIFLTPKPEELKGFYYSKQYTVKGTGTFLQFLIFFERLANKERILNISSLKVTSKGKKRKGRFQMVDAEINLEAYRYNANYKEERGIKEIEEKFSKGNKRRKKRRGRR